MSTAVFVVDTSYLLELFRVPSRSNKNANEEIKKRFEKEEENDSRFYVPLACVYELANHIANVRNGNLRKKLAGNLNIIVRSSVEEGTPWIITPATDLKELPILFKRYADEYVIQKISLTDTSVVLEANRLKKKYSDSGYTVHIWTKDNRLKAFEPDIEINPFPG